MAMNFNTALNGEAADTSWQMEEIPTAPEIAPAAPYTVPQPPKTPEEHAQRVEGWQGFLQQMRTDPSMRRAALHAATQLAQGPGYGQSTFGHLTQSLEGGVQAYDYSKQNLQKQEIEAQQRDLALKEFNAQQQGRAEDRATRKQLLPLQLAKAQREARNPTEEAMQTQFLTWARSSEGLRKPGESLETWKARGWDVVREQQKQQNLGALAMTANAVAGNLMATPEDQAAAAAVQRQILTGGKSPLAQRAVAPTAQPIPSVPVPPGFKSAEEAKAAGMLYLNGVWYRKKQ